MTMPSEKSLPALLTSFLLLLALPSASWSQGSDAGEPVVGSFFFGGGTITDTTLEEDTTLFVVGVSSFPTGKPFDIGGTIAARFGTPDSESALAGIRAYELSVVPRLDVVQLFAGQRDEERETPSIGAGIGIGVGYMVFERIYTESSSWHVSIHQDWHWDHLFLHYGAFCWVRFTKRAGVCVEYATYDPITGGNLIEAQEFRLGLMLVAGQQ